jgi:predicted porin
MTYKCGPGGTGCGTAVGDIEAKQWGVGIAVPVGPGAIRASYAKADDLEGLGADNGASQWNIGYDHRFSKRTTVGVGYAIIKNDPAAVFTWSGAPTSQNGQSVNPPAGSDPSAFFVSMIHRF